ncbi:hypothetical protein L2E82_19452 [Cichorium intybus]|uniref:Uncharacterized protein n=1 Tax=Cichorium intybus TaxID=13427 RepID=A0ACB9FC36_CICIN|nr:hypothetical protein L2E82_19452 [Cichorium intybus]
MLLKYQLLVRSDSTDQLWCIADLGQPLSKLHLRFRDHEFKRAKCGGHGFPHGGRRPVIIFPFTLVHPHTHSPLLNPAGKILLSIFHSALTSHSYRQKFTSIVNVFTGILKLNNTNFLNCFLGLKSLHAICNWGGRSKMSTPARKRLMRDFKRLQNDPPAGISGAPVDNNIMLWNAVIFGPDDTPWDGGTFKLTLQFSEDYPNKPPTVRFISRMFHPNIYADGSICLDILQNQWSPIYDVAAILTSIQSLLCDPNPNSPANSEAARMFSENKREYNRKVREIVEQSWTAD